MFERIATVSRLIRDLRDGFSISPIVLALEELRSKLDREDAFIETIMEEGIVL